MEQETSDIDWFFTNSIEIGFVASGGGRLPESVVENWNESRLLISFFKGFPVIAEVIINPMLNEIKNGKADKRYLSDFVAMAERGIFAYDKTVLGDYLDLNYHLVASPTIPFNFNALPDELKDQLIKSMHEGSMTQSLDVGSIS